MRPLILSAAGWLGWSVALGAPTPAAPAPPPAAADTGVSQLPVGQVYKQFQFPYYQAGQLKFVLTAADATGVTISHADTHDLKIDIYSEGKVTTTITSPDADLYVADRKMRTNHTVRVVRPDLIAISQFCDFDLVSKQYFMRNNVKVTLLHFDAGKSISKDAAAAPTPLSMAVVPKAPPAAPVSIPRPFVPPPPSVPPGEGDLIDSPGAYSTTPTTPLPQ
jgi:hypothetical protein